jgi:D-alanyl-D-alanine carboxypeptidase (penicillin-binding protein 5/6)
MADSLAIWAFGSLGDYQKAAQNEVLLLGMDSTKIGSDASGFDPGTKSTPTDLVKLGNAVISNPVLASIVSKQSAVVPVAGTVYNTNKLLGSNGVVGIKTGHSDEAGACLLFAANYNLGSTGKTTIVGVIQNALDRQTAAGGAASVLKTAEANLSVRQLTEAHQTIAVLKLPWTDAIPLKTDGEISMPVWNETSPKRSVQINDFGSARILTGDFKTIDADHPAGTLSESFGNLTKTVNLVPDQVITSPSLAWRLTHPI